MKRLAFLFVARCCHLRSTAGIAQIEVRFGGDHIHAVGGSKVCYAKCNRPWLANFAQRRVSDSGSPRSASERVFVRFA